MTNSNDRKPADGTASTQPDSGDFAKDPTIRFDNPEQVLTADDLTEAQKIEVLRAWEVDARQLMAASEENMQGGEESKLDGVLASLKRLGQEPSDPAGPSKVGL